MNTTPYWFEASELPSFPSLTSDKTVDVAVIGGGITGVTTAYLLKEAGLKVALIERDRCGRADTGHTTAHLTCVTDLRLQELVNDFGSAAARAVWDAGAVAIDQIAENVKREQISCGFKWIPAFLHEPREAKRGSAREFLEKEASVARDLGIYANYTASIPFVDLPGVSFPYQALFHPLRYLAALLKSIDGLGSFVFENTNVDEVTEKPLSIKAGNHKVSCDYVVIATHNPLMGKAGLVSATLFQTKLYPYSTYALSARLPVGSLPEGSLWDTKDPYDYLRVERGTKYDHAIFGGQDHKTGQVSDTQSVFAALEKSFLAFAPQAEIDHRWSGQVIETNDGLPFIGEIAEKQFVATGFSGNGMTFGTLAALMARDQIQKKRNPWAELFNLHRKKPSTVLDYLKENKDYPYFAIRDRLAAAEDDSLDALGKGEGKILRLGGKKVAAYRDAKGKVTLCSSTCTHLGGIVHWNNAERTWDCPCHGARFTATGEVLAGPAEEPLEKISP